MAPVEVGQEISVRDMQHVEEFLKCAVSILHLDDEWGYHGVGGTAFYVRYRNRVLAVTADHCVRDYDISKIGLASMKAGPLEVVRIRRAVKVEVANADPSAPYVEKADVAFLDPVTVPDPAEVSILDLEAEHVVDTSRLHLGGLHAASGYPRTDSIDYDAAEYRPTQYFSLGKYAGPHATIEGCHAVDASPPPQGPDGMSGSPVACTALVGDEWEPGLSGMMLMWSNGRQHFLDVAHLLEHLRNACRTLDEQDAAASP